MPRRPELRLDGVVFDNIGELLEDLIAILQENNYPI